MSKLLCADEGFYDNFLTMLGMTGISAQSPMPLGFLQNSIVQTGLR
jgi:hypothetical protein